MIYRLNIIQKNALAWNNKGGVYLGLSKFVDALVCFNEAIMIDPDYHLGWNNKGVTLRQMGRYKEALECHEKALELNNDAHTLNQLGRVTFLLEDHNNSLTYFDKALKMDPKYYPALYGKGVVLRETADYENALKCFNKAITINPNYQEDHWLASRPSGPFSQPSLYNISETETPAPIRLDLSKSSRGADLIQLDPMNKSKGPFEKPLEPLNKSKGPFEIQLDPMNKSRGPGDILLDSMNKSRGPNNEIQFAPSLNSSKGSFEIKNPLATPKISKEQL
jgi:tetratricopeptide (TPR) repeat protein